MSNKIKIMIVEDSLTMRNFLFQAFSDIQNIEIISYASNGKLAIPRIKFYQPDFVILDYEMPLMDGIETIKEIKKQNIETNIIMFSAYTYEGAEVTLEALKEGAIDFVSKPNFKAHPQEIVDYIKKNLIQKIIELSIEKKREQKEQKQEQKKETKLLDKEILINRFSFDLSKIEIVGIGISTGGPIVLHEIVKNLPRIKKIIVIVQHMPPLFTLKLAESLNKISKNKVLEAQDQMILEEGCIYIAPGGFHLGIDKNNDDYIARLYDDPPINNCKPSVDFLFDSLSKFGNKAVGIIMTGMGIDGYEGIKKMYRAGCYTIAQSPESCVVYGMPKKPIEENLVYEILSPIEISNFLKKTIC
ncbi:MAG: chemotaxis-specific protein-glutamate methyltransferase CheB [Leptospiraceae bacterium]|nr:chemotaxis-specific protein-glutamate methyltransferase CheB [Leptospiraceae bacterium]MDW7975797.1 chemotaxis-specific protein-glutamate methyltransferase CheB [Leptospiraceae bacterium]